MRSRMRCLFDRIWYRTRMRICASAKNEDIPKIIYINLCLFSYKNYLLSTKGSYELTP